jgi:two-component system NtrC family sensor kinase
LERTVVNCADAQAEPDPQLRDYAHKRGLRAVLVVPLLRDDRVEGALVLSRAEPGLFASREIELVQTFADQAVIAIQNARLFNETKESLERQTATAEILNVIASSPTDTQPVFDVIARSATELCEGMNSGVYLLQNGLVHVAGHYNVSPEQLALAQTAFPTPPHRGIMSGRAILDRAVAHVPDIAADPEYTAKSIVKAGFRSVVAVPMLRNGEPIGAINVTREEARPFSDRQIELLRTFADQAVIAIENARLFNETKEALERQTATADILKVIASSPSDVQPVFDAIAERSKKLVDALSTSVFRLDDGMMHLRAFTPTNPDADATLRATFPAPLSTFSWGESIRRGEIYRVIDTEHEPEGLRDLARLRGWRSCLCVPLLRDGKPIGMIGPTRAAPGPFTDHHVQLLQTFADQAVIAISNVGLFNEVQERTRELSASLDDLRAAQDRLVQTEKLASLGQLTAGIAHEIKNPLNFVNNFSALSAELIDELDETLAPAPLDQKMRGDVGELTQMLKSNLEKVVQHGKRADSIVKNMLLHSREGSGDHRPVEINRLLDESLNLAYHGARAEKPGFNITLQRDFDPNAGTIELFPQEITRALLNLISNGFYAATNRKTENLGSDADPVLRATTKNLGDSVEIRIRDNGTGIPAEVKEKMFNPFFTTKPAGEGTGLGLSMSHDIFVKQHGGKVDVETELGRFTEFRITLPRKSNFSNRTRGQT